jgi:hypothetical protein
MESHKAGFPPVPHSMEILSGLPHSHGLDNEIRFLNANGEVPALNRSLNLHRREGLVTKAPGPKCNGCSGTLTLRKACIPYACAIAHRTFETSFGSLEAIALKPSHKAPPALSVHPTRRATGSAPPPSPQTLSPTIPNTTTRLTTSFHRTRNLSLPTFTTIFAIPTTTQAASVRFPTALTSTSLEAHGMPRCRPPWASAS